MSSRQTRTDPLDPRLKEEFWEIVVDCMTTLHQFPISQACERSKALRASIEAPPEGLSGELFYHNEPFDVACRLAGQALDLSRYRPEYDQILQRHGWVAEGRAVAGEPALAR